MTALNKYDLIYNDSNIVVVYKKAGILTDSGEGSAVAGAAEGRDRSLTGMLNEYLAASGESAVPCHRLDRNTDGLVIFGKNQAAEAEMTAAIKAHQIEKFYYAEVKGVPKKQSAVLKAYLWKDSKKSVVYIYDIFKKGCVPIETHYKVLGPAPGGNSLMEIKLISGKTHQIRAHMAHIGHPVLGDGKYGDFALNKKLGLKTQKLTAYKIVFHFSDGILKYLDGKTVKKEGGTCQKK